MAWPSTSGIAPPSLPATRRCPVGPQYLGCARGQRDTITESACLLKLTCDSQPCSCLRPPGPHGWHGQRLQEHPGLAHRQGSTARPMCTEARVLPCRWFGGRYPHLPPSAREEVSGSRRCVATVRSSRAHYVDRTLAVGGGRKPRLLSLPCRLPLYEPQIYSS